jgi:hypothetical protein
MKLDIVPYSAEHVDAVRAFNARLRAGNETEFILSEHVPPKSPPDDAIGNHFYLTLEGDDVRGGFLLVEYPGSLGGVGVVRSIRVLNLQAPLSEGIVDNNYSLVALRQLKWIQQQCPHIFALGMGSAEARFSRLLRGAGWTLMPVPFFFRVTRTSRFLEELIPLRTSIAMQLVARAAIVTGAGLIGVAALQARSLISRRSAQGYSLEPVSKLGDWVDSLWAEYRLQTSFAIMRDHKTLENLYRAEVEKHLGLFVLRCGGEIAGWVATFDRLMRNHKYFGNMHVGTIVDAVTLPGAMAPAIDLAVNTLATKGADLVVANHSHRDWIRAFRQCGFLAARSNYILALSRNLAKAIVERDGGFGSMHFTRGDSDGRINL